MSFLWEYHLITLEIRKTLGVFKESLLYSFNYFNIYKNIIMQVAKRCFYSVVINYCLLLCSMFHILRISMQSCLLFAPLFVLFIVECVAHKQAFLITFNGYLQNTKTSSLQSTSNSKNWSFLGKNYFITSFFLHRFLSITEC